MRVGPRAGFGARAFEGQVDSFHDLGQADHRFMFAGVGPRGVRIGDSRVRPDR